MLLHKRADLCVPAQLLRIAFRRHAVFGARIGDLAAVRIENLYSRESVDPVFLDKAFVVPHCWFGEKRLVVWTVDEDKHEVLLRLFHELRL